MREPEQRVTALLNGEVQIAKHMPPQLVRRLENRKDVKIQQTGGIEVMFVAFNNKMAPWTDVRMRKAAAHAINRDLIVKRLLGGYAQVQDGIIGPNQMCYTGAPERPNSYDPAKSKALLAEAGFRDGGPEIDFYTAVGRYTSDRQVAEAVAQMLRQVGFRVRLHTPEYANFWADVRRGKTPMYYMGRGTVFDASDAVRPAVRHRRLAARAVFQSEIRRAPAGAIRRSRSAEALPDMAAVEPDPGRRRAKPLHVDPHADHRRARQCRHQDRIVRRDVAAVGQDAMRRPRLAHP